MRWTALIAWCVVPVLLPPVARAQHAPSDPNRAPLAAASERADASRTLNEHAFLPAFSVPWAFVATWVGSRTGVGVYDLPIVAASGRRLTVDGRAKLVAFSQTFDVNVALTHWLGLSVALAGGHAIGVNPSGAFNIGVNYAYGGHAAVVASLLRRRSWHLGLRVQASLLRAAGVVPERLTAAVREEDGQLVFDTQSVIQEGRLVRGGLHFVLAESHTRYFGVQASVGVDVSRLELDAVERRGAALAGAVGSLRFDELGVPITILLGGSVRVGLDHNDEQFASTLEPRGTVTGQAETGLFYSDPKYVDVGAQGTLELGESERRGQVRFVINHFW